MPNRPFRFPVTHASIATVPTDETDFTETVQRHRSELHRHCVRLLGSHADAEDALQETLLRAWRSRRAQTADSPRGWLYAIATNACHDVIARRDQASLAVDHEPAAPPEQEPDATLIARETVELALLTAIQHLSPLQQASFVMRDVLNLVRRGHRDRPRDEPARHQQRPPARPPRPAHPARPGPARLGLRPPVRRAAPDAAALSLRPRRAEQ